MALKTTNTLEPVEQHIGGDTLRLPFSVPDNDSADPDARKDLTDATIVWALIDWDETVVLSTADDGVSVAIGDPTAGEFRVEIEGGTGEDLEGTYEEWVRVETQAGDRQTWVGEFEVEEGAI